MATKLDDTQELEVLAVLRTLKQVVEEVGDNYVYQQKRQFTSNGQLTPSAGCWYVNQDTNEPDCLVGRVLFRLGVPIDLLRRYEGVNAGSLPSLDRYQTVQPIPLHQAALDVLQEAQGVQDVSGNWGDARDRALMFAYQTYGIKGANK